MNTSKPAISLKQLHYALAVAQTLHFKKAADQCAISQSALSTAISELEQQLGIQIFERDPKKVLITPLGKDILAQAQRIQLEVRSLELHAHRHQNPLNYPLSIGVIPTIGPYLLPKVLPAIHRHYPDAKLHLIEEQSHLLVEQVRSGQLDTAIIALPYPHEGLLSFPFWQENIVLVVHKKDEMADLESIKGKSLKHKSLLLLREGHCLTDHSLKACKIKTLTDNLSLEGSSLYTLVQMVALEMGATLVPDMAVKPLLQHNKSLRSLAIDEKGPHRQLTFITRPAYPLVDDIQHLVDLFKHQLKKNS